jgi:hypothetical protein
MNPSAISQSVTDIQLYGYKVPNNIYENSLYPSLTELLATGRNSGETWQSVCRHTGLKDLMIVPGHTTGAKDNSDAINIQ